MNTPRTLATIHLPATVQELQTILAAFPRHAGVHWNTSSFGFDIVVDEPEQPEQTGDVISRQLVLNKLAQARDTSPGDGRVSYVLDVLTAAIEAQTEERPSDSISRHLVLNKLRQAYDTSATGGNDVLNLIHFFEGIDNS